MDFSSLEAYLKSVQPNRDRLKQILGVVDERVPFTDLEYVGGPKTPSLVAETDDYKVFAVRWPVLPGVDGEGLLLEPKGKIVADVVAIPDADWTPEMLVGMAPGVPEEEQFARALAASGCRVIVPVLIDRKDDWSGNPVLGKMTNQPHREFIYRMGYEIGRHVIGYEIQKVLAAVDWFCRDKEHPRIAVYGDGEGGLLAFYSGAIDERIDTTVVAGYFGPREGLWKEPIYRNVFGLLCEFGDAELAANLFYPAPQADGRERIHRLVLTTGIDPVVDGPPTAADGRSGAVPGRLVRRPFDEQIMPEFNRSLKLNEGKGRRVTFLPFYSAGGYLDVIYAVSWVTDPKFKGVVANPKPLGDPPADQRKSFDPKDAYTASSSSSSITRRKSCAIPTQPGADVLVQAGYVIGRKIRGVHQALPQAVGRGRARQASHPDPADEPTHAVALRQA